jgi:hypothetical protein
MSLETVDMPPGVVKVDTEYAAQGRFIDQRNVRWQGGRWEDMGGWTKWIPDQLQGVPRHQYAWRDLSQTARLAVGTNSKLYYVSGGMLFDITPFAQAALTNLANAITCVSGSGTFTIHQTGHGQLDGDTVVITNADTVGGVALQGPYTITYVDPNTYTVSNAIAATSTVSSPTGNITVQTFRAALTNPFTTTSGSNQVEVAHTAHGRGVGDTVYFQGFSAVGGLTLNGTFIVSNVLDTDHYMVTAPSPAGSSAGPGGGSGTYLYELNIGNVDSIPANGYGVGPYGGGTYGTPRDVSITLSARTWALDNFQDVLIANPRGGAIYEWIPGSSDRATVIPNSPATAEFAFVAEELTVHALGVPESLQEDMWSDIGDRTVWAATETNSARNRTVASSTGFISGRRFRNNVGAAWTESDAWAIQYTADDFVYDLRVMAGTGGLCGPHSHGLLLGVCYWMGPTGFFRFDGVSWGSVDDRDIHQFVFRDINLTQKDKFISRVTERYAEIMFYYCSAAATEIDRAIAFYPQEQRAIAGVVCGYQDTDQLRTSWSESIGIYPNPLGCDAMGHLYEHDNGATEGDGAVLKKFVRTGAFELPPGDQTVDVAHVVPDMQRQVGNLGVTIFSRPHPQGALTANGPYAFPAGIEKVDLVPRVHGRQFAIYVESNTMGGTMRTGRWRFDVVPGGER